MKSVNILLIVLIVVSFSGCFINPPPGQNTLATFSGTVSASEGEFEMQGNVGLDVIPSEKQYENVTVELYDEHGDLIHREELGNINNMSDRLNVSVTHPTVPQYVIFDSPDFWGGEITIDYYVLADSGAYYELEATSDRSKLPISPDG